MGKIGLLAWGRIFTCMGGLVLRGRDWSVYSFRGSGRGTAPGKSPGKKLFERKARSGPAGAPRLYKKEVKLYHLGL